jgi:hypothetical protein
MMFPKGLPITVLTGLKGVTIPVNLPKFTSFLNEDLATHVERFVTILITNLVTNHDYYLIWFPSTLVDFAFVWYKSHAEGSFNTWEQLQAAF